MKRIILIVLLALAIIGVNGCRQNKKTVTRSADGKLNVTAAIFPAYDFVRQIAGDKVNLSMLLPPGAESHSFEPSPRDIITIQNSGIFIYIGGETDEWVSRILESMETGNMKILAMMDTVDVVEEEIVEGMEDEDDHHEKHASHHDDDHDDDPYSPLPTPHSPTYDEHVWTSPQNAAKIVRAITEALCEADAANAELYRKNSAAYIEKLLQLDSAFKGAVSGAARKTIVFADRFPFRYFADAYGLSYFAAFPGCSTETEPSAATVAFLITKVKAEKIPVVFHIELSNERMADTISGETGAKKLLLHSCHNLTKRDFDAGLGYIELMQNNIANLREALY